MPLQLLPAEPADAKRAAAIEHDAYAPRPSNRILFPGPFPDDVLDRSAADLVEDLRTDRTTRWWKIVETELQGDEALVAFARWNIFEAPAPPPKPRTFGPGTNPEACEALFGGISRQRERLVGGQSYVCRYHAILIGVLPGGGF